MYMRVPSADIAAPPTPAIVSITRLVVVSITDMLPSPLLLTYRRFPTTVIPIGLRPTAIGVTPSGAADGEIGTVTLTAVVALPSPTATVKVSVVEPPLAACARAAT